MAILKMGSKGPDVTRLQELLRKNGSELVVDGDFGKATDAAVKLFQGAHKLEVDGEVGPATLRALEGEGKSLPSVLAVAPWLTTMRALTGTHETVGSKNSPVIMSWVEDIARATKDQSIAKYVRKEYTADLIPWCGLCVAKCVADAGIEPIDGFLYARNWIKWGSPLKKGVPGAVLVFTRKGGGHVAFYEGEDKTHFVIRGGNQSDSVTLMRKAKSELLKNGIRWPEGWDVPKAGSGLTSTAGLKDSKNEA